MSDIKNILFSGVGGQGILLASELTAAGLLLAGYDVKKSEVHGMAQRGGSVTAQLRYGKKVYSPLIDPGCADIQMAFEMMEAVRYLPYLHQGSMVIVNTQQILPPSVATGQATYPENVLDELTQRDIRSLRLMPLPSPGRRERYERPMWLWWERCRCICRSTRLIFEKIIEERVPERFRAENMKAFAAGREAGGNEAADELRERENEMATIYWEEEIETMPRVGLESIQLKRLQKLVARVYETVEPYRRKMDAAGVKPGDIRQLSDLQKLPFTIKDDLRDNYPFGMFTVPLDDVVRVHASSGTTGKPTVVGYTKKDIETWAELMARALSCAGATSGDMVHNAYGYGLFTGGLGAHYGAEKLGATVIPVSGGNTKRQITIMQDFGSTVLLSTPSYALNLAEAMEAMGIDPASLSLRVGIFGAEPWSENMREEVERKLNLKAVDIYGLSEVIGPGVALECLTVFGRHAYFRGPFPARDY